MYFSLEKESQDATKLIWALPKSCLVKLCQIEFFAMKNYAKAVRGYILLILVWYFSRIVDVAPEG